MPDWVTWEHALYAVLGLITGGFLRDVRTIRQILEKNTLRDVRTIRQILEKNTKP